MKQLILFALLLGILGVQPRSLASDASEFTGLWIMPDASALLQIRPEQHESDSNGESYEIVIVAVLHETLNSSDGARDVGQPRLDKNNPDPAFHARPLAGTRIGWGFEKSAGSLSGGRIYDPESGKTYRAELELEPDGLLRLRAFLGISLIGQTMHWHPAEEFKVSMLKLLTHIP